MRKTLSADDLQKWKMKRGRTFVTFMLQATEAGLSISVVATVLWSYLKTEVNCNHKKLFYGIISCMHGFPAILFSISISKWLDNTRNSKQCMVLFNALGAIGHLVFMLPYSPFLLILGRILDGFTISLKAVMASEVSRSYPREELQKKLPLFTFFAMIGFAIGPAIAFCFTHVDFYVGRVHISWGSCCSFILFLISVIQMLVVIIFGHNLSKEYDLKQHEVDMEMRNFIHTIQDDVGESNASSEYEVYSYNAYKEVKLGNENDGDVDTEDDIDENEELLSTTTKKGKVRPSSSSYKTFLKKILLNNELRSLIALTLIGEFWDGAFYRAIPFILIEVINFNKTSVSIFYFGYALVVMVLVLIITRSNAKDRGVFYIGFSSYISLLVLCACCIFISKDLPSNFNVVLLAVYCPSLCYYTLSEKVFVSVTYAKMVASENQGIGEGLRITFKFFGALCGSVLSIYIYEYFKYVSVVLIATTLSILLFLFVRRRTFCNPTPLV